MSKRLTKEQIINATTSQLILERTTGKQMANKMVSELVEYKEIEEELGIDLITLFTHKTMWVKWEVRKTKRGADGLLREYTEIAILERKVYFINIQKKTIAFSDGWSFGEIPLNGFGKTFALTKDALKEKEEVNNENR